MNLIPVFYESIFGILHIPEAVLRLGKQSPLQASPTGIQMAKRSYRQDLIQTTTCLIPRSITAGWSGVVFGLSAPEKYCGRDSAFATFGLYPATPAKFRGLRLFREIEFRDE
jgi:hypothetical protein